MAILERLEASARARNHEDDIENIRAVANKNQFPLTKTIRAGNSGKAVIAVTPNNIDLSVADTDNGEPVGFSVIGGKGNIISGPVGFTAKPSEIKISGMWTLNDAILSGFPSTIVTPIPMAKFTLPLSYIADFASSAVVLAAFFGSFV